MGSPRSLSGPGSRERARSQSGWSRAPKLILGLASFAASSVVFQGWVENAFSQLAPFRGSREGGRGVIPSFLPQEKVDELEEVAAISALKSLQRQVLKLPYTIYKNTSGPVEATFVRTSVEPSEAPPVVLLHGFDSSCLEFRRLMPELEALEIEAYALDILGWGFTKTDNIQSVSVDAKREHLFAFWQTVLNARPMVLVGVSLGAALITDFYASHRLAVAGTVLVDPQAFIDGAPPVPEPLAGLGISVLGSWPLRSMANDLAYYDKEKMATDDAIRIGQLHTFRPGWQEDSEEWLVQGGYSVSWLVQELAEVPCLIMWGRQDEILPPSVYLPKFLEVLPDAIYRWVDDCGHSPHLEQPKTLAETIHAFLFEEEVQGEDASKDVPEATLVEQLGAAFR